jgi:poly-gamma-glutamate capsule biosynthesis protein CapA/YwtB (metallophosphatase superfamily)
MLIGARSASEAGQGAVMVSSPQNCRAGEEGRRLCVFLCGDVMTGRGIDQILPNPCDPRLEEDHVRSARDYVRVAERANGPIPAQRPRSYIWGAALDAWDRIEPDARIINLETSITRRNSFSPKGINYRMSPENAACLKDAAIDCCALANNHVLDFGREGLLDTLDALERLEIKYAGAGRTLDEARAPAILEIAGKGRLIFFSFASTTSGTPQEWAVTDREPGVNLLPESSEVTIGVVSDWARKNSRPGDVIIVSIHWGPNWGYWVPEEQRRLAHDLIDRAGVAAIHGHSSHHPKGIEIYKGRLILYGCGDFLNDYEGISGYEEYRSDLTLMYFATFEPPTGRLSELELIPLQMRRLQLVAASEEDVSWMERMLEHEGRRYGTQIEVKLGKGLGVT